MNVGDSFSLSKAIGRSWEQESIREFHRTIVQKCRMIVWSWGSRGWTVFSNALRFRVSGRLFKGYVYVTVNGKDLFDIHCVGVRGKKVIKKQTDIYVSDIVEAIDRLVETE